MSHCTVALAEIEAVAAAALRAHGAADWVAAEVACAVREAEALANRICGLYYLESYCLQLRSGRVRGDVAPVVERLRPASVRVDAGFGFAQPAFARGIEEAVSAARECGTAGLAICRAHTCTALGFFTRRIAAAGLIGLGFTNASAIVAAPGGRRRLLGTNPIALSVPARDGGLAFEFDLSTSAVALGKITQAAAAGRAIPLGWALDADGRPTTDPQAALQGSLLPAGGHKGYGFALLAEVMAAALTGGRNSSDISALKAAEGAPHGIGQSYLLIEPALYAGEDFWARLAQLEQAVAADPGARLPGAARQWPAQVEIDAALWAQSRALAGR